MIFYKQKPKKIFLKWIWVFFQILFYEILTYLRLLYLIIVVFEKSPNCTNVHARLISSEIPVEGAKNIEIEIDTNEGLLLPQREQSISRTRN